ncbi:B-cell receptor CD22 isoform X4 [Clarias gariepinus]|uniref:B-cell receptor CD22 isoform X4 n=1 Tax=Clarias gariepinus TaxID=13013 RepID=UPI00234DF0D4|nr:B-cell receptor CD22 isoform X4 [Clarias gariepinus]
MNQCLLLLLMSVLHGSTLRPELSGPSMAFLKSTVAFKCKLTGSPSPLTFELIKNNDEVLERNSNPITFSLKVNMGSEGVYVCRVTSGNQTSISNPVHLQVVIPVQGVSIVSEPNPPVIYEGEGFKLSCEARMGTHLGYSWYHNEQEMSSPSPLHHFVGNMLTVNSSSEWHAGSYLCVAKNLMGNNSRSSSSEHVTVVVKKYISPPRLSFTLFQNGTGYYANLSCQLAYGSPPVMFQLFFNGKSVDVQQLNLLEAWFIQPVTIGLYMGKVQCIAKNNIQHLFSNSIRLEVVLVTGTALVQVEYLHRAESEVTAVLLKCVITAGTFPVFSWSFNGSTIPLGANSPTFVQHDQVIVLTHISPENSGYYSCRARDSFNSDSSWLESEEVLVKMTDHVNHQEHRRPENHHNKPETIFEPRNEDMETTI